MFVVLFSAWPMAKSAVAKAACTPRAKQVKKSRQLKVQPSSEEVQAAAQTKADAVFMKGCAKAKKRLDAQADKLKLSCQELPEGQVLGFHRRGEVPRAQDI